MSSTPTPVDEALKPTWARDSELLPEFPKLNPEAEFAALKVLQEDGTALRQSLEDWEGARARVRDVPTWEQWLEDLTAETGAWMERHQDRPSWQAGWLHDFVSPVDGAPLVWEDAVPGEECAAVRSSTGAPVEVTPLIFGGWVYSFRVRHLAVLVNAARLYRLTEDLRFLDWAAAQLDFYSENYEAWPETRRLGNSARLGCQSLDDATMVTNLVEAARLLRPYVSQERFQVWAEGLFKPEAELLDRSFHVIHNIGLWLRAAQGQIALLLGDEAMWHRSIHGEFGVRNQLLRGVTSEYFWYEQSMSYNDYVVSAMLTLLEFASVTGDRHSLAEEAAIVQNLALAPLQVRFPDGTLPNPADAGAPKHAPSKILGRIYRVLPTSIGLEQARQLVSWDTLLDPPVPMPGAIELPKVASRVFPSSRFAVLNSGPWQIFFHFGQVNQSHAHAEALNWSASLNGTMITYDPGTVGYGSPLCRGYYTRGLNHNVPLADGEGQQRWSPGEITLFEENKATALQKTYRQGVSAQRTLKIEDGVLFDEVSLTSSSPMRMGLSLHLQGSAELSSQFAPCDDFATDRPEPFQYWVDLVSCVFEDAAELSIRLPEGSELQVRFQTSGRFILFHGRSPAEPPHLRNGFYLEKLEHCDGAMFTTQLTPV